MLGIGRKLSLTIGYNSDVGIVRTENQDCYGKFPEDSDDLRSPMGQLFIVADGMGGHSGGQQASQLAVDAVQRVYFSDSGHDLLSRLKTAFEVANREIYDHSAQKPELRGMGTTCTALALQHNRGYIAHVGDSRVYRINRRKIEQLTSDHSKVAELMREGVLTEKQAKTHPQRSILSRALGVDQSVEVDIIDEIALRPGDYYLLCTDGLAKVTDDEIKSIVLSNSVQDACEKLINVAIDRGGDDNVTVQVIRIEGGKKVFGIFS